MMEFEFLIEDITCFYGRKRLQLVWSITIGRGCLWAVVVVVVAAVVVLVLLVEDY